MYYKINENESDIVIVGAGICGLATALAFHRKGIRSVVLERSETLRATGTTITIFANGWRALQQLAVTSTLRSTALAIERIVDVLIGKGVVRDTPMRDVEARCLRRMDLIEALANELPSGTIRFGCQMLSVDVDKSSSDPIIRLHDGSLIKAKVLIGCDGANSVVANFIGLKPTQLFCKTAVRGITIYPNGHGFAPEFLRMKKDSLLLGRIPVDEKTVYWFVIISENGREAEIAKDPASIMKLTLDSYGSFPTDIVEMIKNSELNSLWLNKLRYRSPWNLLLGNLRKETMTVAGEAWHPMCPFIGQGGSAALEDAIVLARCLSKKTNNSYLNGNEMILSKQKTKEALDEYLKERRMRVLSLSTQTHLIGLTLVGDLPLILRFICLIILVVLFGDSLNHTRYNCGHL